MQFDIDSSGENRETFFKARDILLSYPEIREQQNDKQTAYYDPYGLVCFLRGRDEGLYIVLGRGKELEMRYPFLTGEGKIVRHWVVKSPKELNAKRFKAIIEETTVLNLEYREMMKLYKARKKRTTL